MGDPVTVEASAIAFGYSRRGDVVNNISLTVRQGELLAIAGENGSGKSTLIRVLCGLLSGFRGAVNLMGHAIGNLSREELSRMVAYVPQIKSTPFRFTVRELIELGAYPRIRRGANAAKVIEEAAALSGLDHILSREIQELSGGELQRAHIAAAVAQDAPILMLDEPSSFLDLRAQKAIYELLRSLSLRGRTVVVTDHNLNLLSCYAHRLVFLREGRVVGDGRPEEVLTVETIKAVYNTEVGIYNLVEVGFPLVYLRRNSGDGLA